MGSGSDESIYWISTSSGRDSATFRLIAQCLNHYAATGIPLPFTGPFLQKITVCSTEVKLYLYKNVH
jgi:hypothetical protein